MNLARRLDKLSAALEERRPKADRHLCFQIVGGDETGDQALDRLIAVGEVDPHERDLVVLIMRSIIEPIWEMGTDGNERLAGRRNIHTGEVEVVDWGR